MVYDYAGKADLRRAAGIQKENWGNQLFFRDELKLEGKCHTLLLIFIVFGIMLVNYL